MDRETRDLEKHLQRTPRKKDNQVISNFKLFFEKNLIPYSISFYEFQSILTSVLSQVT